MNGTLRRTDRTRGRVVAGSLTARSLLWGLPAELGLAAAHGRRAGAPRGREGRGESFAPVRVVSRHRGSVAC